MPTDRRFTGQRWDSALALYDYRARYYDPALGRFISADPVVPEPGNPQGLNRCGYVLNNSHPRGVQPMPVQITRCGYQVYNVATTY